MSILSGPNRRHKNFGGLLRVDSVQELLPHFGLDFFLVGLVDCLFSMGSIALLVWV